ncbi:hypothetical protein M404DRAFT_295080 [Pisolithus tinctorius Marx 270]|uniref:Uncharacterized protein n=1 Tax=Pisolithus tinctorius Marx 270 TaxID=870435 RepID=A0A0C3IFS1_PISTI|nr:hypothetical protein M404DRAFT_295080 [Pisolithus tinctorius Marx 270]
MLFFIYFFCLWILQYLIWVYLRRNVEFLVHYTCLAFLFFSFLLCFTPQARVPRRTPFCIAPSTFPHST